MRCTVLFCGCLLLLLSTAVTVCAQTVKVGEQCSKTPCNIYDLVPGLSQNSNVTLIGSPGITVSFFVPRKDYGQINELTVSSPEGQIVFNWNISVSFGTLSVQKGAVVLARPAYQSYFNSSIQILNVGNGGSLEMSRDATFFVYTTVVLEAGGNMTMLDRAFLFIAGRALTSIFNSVLYASENTTIWTRANVVHNAAADIRGLLYVDIATYTLNGTTPSYVGSLSGSSDLFYARDVAIGKANTFGGPNIGGNITFTGPGPITAYVTSGVVTFNGGLKIGNGFGLIARRGASIIINSSCAFRAGSFLQIDPEASLSIIGHTAVFDPSVEFAVGGTLLVDNAYIDGGLLLVIPAGSSFVAAGATTINGSVVVLGSVVVAGRLNILEHLVFMTNQTQLTIPLASEAVYGFIHVGQTVQYGGELKVTVGYRPSKGTWITLIDYGLTGYGAFASLTCVPGSEVNYWKYLDVFVPAATATAIPHHPSSASKHLSGMIA